MAHGFRRFHRLFRASAGRCPAGGLLLLGGLLIVAPPARAQRAWGDAATLVPGPAAAAPHSRSVSISPLNPASGMGVGRAVEASLAIPMGVRELAIQRVAVRVPVRETVVSFALGRSGFDRLVRHRFSAGLARVVTIGEAGGTRRLSAGVRTTFDRFSTPAGPIALEYTLIGGGQLQVSDAARVGLVATSRPADAHGARAADVTGAAAFDAGRHLGMSIGWRHASGADPELSSAVRLDTDWGGSLTIAIGSGHSGPGIVFGIRRDALLIRMAWLRAGPAGATRLVSAAFMTRRHIDE